MIYRYKLLLLIVLMTWCLSLSSQSKRDYIWTFGYDGISEPGIQAYRFDFNQVPFKPIEITHPFRIDNNNAAICDEEGNLLFYTNGCAISNANNEIMENGMPINYGPFLVDYWEGTNCQGGYPGNQDIVIITDPKNEFGYYIIHKPRAYDLNQDPSFFIEELRVTYVDMELGNGKGAVTTKDSTFYLGDRILSNYLTAISHQNGSDWWILQPVELTNRYKRFLIDSEGIHELEDQSIGPVFHWNASAGGTARFSPDGTKYAYYNNLDGLLLFDFDRTIGELSNLRQLDVLGSPAPAVFTSIEWSSNSRFIYSANRTELYQIDTEELILENGNELIGTYDGTQNPFPNTFFLMALAPDCKIYMCSTSGNQTYHVINDPNQKGADCDFAQNGLELPINAGFGSMPNFPRWRVDEEEKCDPSIVSMFGEVVYYNTPLNLYPNPSPGPITIELPKDKTNGIIRVTDSAGNEIFRKEIEQLTNSYSMDLSSYPRGIYFMEYLPKDHKQRKVYTSKFILE